MCKDPTGQKNNKYPNTDSCIGPKKEETFLNTYNCDYIRPPKPQRFDRARKQIYQTSYVWSHFVHCKLTSQAKKRCGRAKRQKIMILTLSLRLRLNRDSRLR